MAPVVLVTADRRRGEGLGPGPRVRPVRDQVWVLEAYVHAVREAGGLPLVLPPGPADPAALLAVAHAVVLTGGEFDIHPSLYGQAPTGRIDRVEADRTELELELARTCVDRRVPVLGVCGGMQVLAVATGGTLVQDLPAALGHEQANDPAQPSHRVVFTHDDHASALGLAREVEVNSTHHQAVDLPGAFQIVARSPDGVAEAVVDPRHPFAWGVQWHPELIGQQGPYERLVAAAQSLTES